jgi:alcohol dehydrogenase
VVVIGRHPERWDLLHQQGIATAHVGSLDERRKTKDESGAAYTGPSSFDIVVDCTGQPSGLAVARNLVRPRGRLVLKSTFAAESGMTLSRLVVDEVQLLGSRCGPFAPALRLLDRGLVQVQPLVAGQFALRNGLNAFTAASRHLKILLEI